MRPALVPVPVGRAGVIATHVRRAEVDRLVWGPREREGTVDLPRGRLHVRPAARGRFSVLHRATDGDGSPAWVRVSAPRLTGAYAAGHAMVLDLAIGAVVPTLRRVECDGVWIECLPWSVGGEPTAGAVGAYVVAALRTPLHDGVIVSSGEPHILHDGSIVVEDVLVTACPEADERRLLTDIVLGLAGTEPGVVVEAVARLCLARPPGLADAVRRCAVALLADWTPVALGLGLHHVAAVAAQTGPRSEPLVLLADELLHRLDLAHLHAVSPSDLSSPRSVADLLLGTDVPR